MKDAVNKMIAQVKEQGRKVLTEVESKAVLEAYAIPVNAGGLAMEAAAAIEIADKIGYPVVMKIVSPDILHKSDAGGVRVGIATAEEVRKAYEDIKAAALAYKPDADVRGVVVQRMVPEGMELVVGATFSRQFGHAVMFGLGGIFVEVMKDVVFRLAPVTVGEALEMIGEIRGSAILGGLRGKPPVDRTALADIIHKLSVLVTEHPEILEVDLNPVIAGERGAVAADARIILGEPRRVAETVYSSDEIVAAMKRIFSPKGIAIIGASGDQAKLGYSTVKNIIDGGYKGRIYPINPKADQILGWKCYRDVREVPDEVDVAVVVIPAAAVADAVAALGEKGVAGAIVISSGFAEIGNDELQRVLVETARRSKVRILGPNIFGLYYTPADLCATFCTPYTEKGVTALSCQSGGVGMAIIGYSRANKMGVSAIVGVGNKCDLDEDDLIEFFGQDRHACRGHQGRPGLPQGGCQGKPHEAHHRAQGRRHAGRGAGSLLPHGGPGRRRPDLQRRFCQGRGGPGIEPGGTPRLRPEFQSDARAERGEYPHRDRRRRPGGPSGRCLQPPRVETDGPG
jgi:acyl-CoA synthetase (NDP forming)